MNRTGTITMSMRELDRIKIIQALVDGDMKPGRAAERLGLTVRQVHRLTRRYQVEGLHGLTSRKRDRPSNNRLPSETARLALTIIRERYTDFGPTLACEKLRERHSLTLAKETVRKLMIEAGLWIPRTLRPPKIYQPRNRRQCLGELVQIDGSEHAWFEDRAPKCTLLVYVDDATSPLALPALHAVGIDVQLFRSDARISATAWQATNLLQRQGRYFPHQSETDGR